MNRLQKLLHSEAYLLLDGAMGTMLMSSGLESGDPPEEWNVLYPERVRAVHRRYIEAGSHIVLTNSFGGTGFRLKLHNLQDRVLELNRAAAVNARAEADAASRLVAVAGSIGPSGELLDPLGNLSFEKAVEGFAEQAKGLAEGGVDLLWIETMSDLREVQAAVEGARSVSSLPIAATLSFDTQGRSMMGVTATQAARTFASWGLTLIGANCGNNLEDSEQAIYDMVAAVPDLNLIVKANAGIPKWLNGELAYDGTPEVMAQYAVRMYQAGAKLIGACCGSTPTHIQAMSAALAQTPVRSANAPVDTSKMPTPMPSTSPAGSTRRRRRRRRRT